MIDLTINSKDKEAYIISIQLVEEKHYKVVYADGKESIIPFSIHNYQVDNRRMEKQYFIYVTQFYDYFKKEKWILLFQALEYSVLFLLGIFLEIRDPNLSNLLLRGLLLLQFVLLSFSYSFRLFKLYSKKKKVDIMKAYMEKKESYTLPVFHPLTGELFTWNLMDLAEIDSFKNPQELEAFRESITPEM